MLPFNAMVAAPLEKHWHLRQFSQPRYVYPGLFPWYDTFEVGAHDDHGWWVPDPDDTDYDGLPVGRAFSIGENVI
jgi:hypothetical protein